MVVNVPIKGIDLDVTNDCVLTCNYCYRGKKNKHKLSWETGTKAIDFLIKHSQNQKRIFISFMGGEPLLEFELIRRLVLYAKKKAMYYGIKIYFKLVTNCVLINNDMIRFFCQHKIGLCTSIDGCPESQDKHRHFPNGNGTSAIIEPKIKKILKFIPDAIAYMTISNDTVNKWFENILYLLNLGYTNLLMLPIPESNWTERQFEHMQCELRKISNFYIDRFRAGSPLSIEGLFDAGLQSIVKPSRQRKHYCGAGKDKLLVATDGTLYPCTGFGRIIDANSRKQWNLGSIFKGINQEKRKIFVNLDCTSQTKADCENCLAVHSCSISCMAMNWTYCYDIFKPHPNYCKYINLFFREAMRIDYILKGERNSLYMKKYYSESQGDENNRKTNHQTCTI
jgi:uncharacterized protein